MQKNDLEKFIGNLIREKVNISLKESGLLPENKTKVVSATVPTKPSLAEAVVVMPNSFILRTEKLSKKTKQNHESLYKKYVDSFNKLSSELDAVNTHEAGSYASAYRALKLDECTNLNSVKLHELYFNNISDMASAISLDSIPYMKLSRDFGSFERWQFDFIACAMSAREGWALTVYEPYKGVYMNVCIDGHDVGIPLGSVPVLAIDMWSHAFYKDYEIDKKSYLIAMMKEINWDVIEARMILAEKSELNALYKIRPIYNDVPEKMLGNAENSVPVDNIKTSDGGNVPPSTPPSADQDKFERL